MDGELQVDHDWSCNYIYNYIFRLIMLNLSNHGNI